MKSVKFAFAALVLAGGIVAAFAFAVPAKKTVPNKWFEFTGDPTDVNAVKLPANYSPLQSAPSDVDPDQVLYAIQVDQATEIYTSGSNIGLPKVDVALSSLQLAILDATGFDGSAPNDISGRVIVVPAQ